MLSKNKVFEGQIIILATTSKEGIAKDGKIIEGIDKMASLAKMGITEMVITKIMEIDKEGI
jgi:hypothetical protein